MKPLNEIEIGGADLDQPPNPVQTKVFICSTPRTGSGLLCRAMIGNKLGVPHEYFHFLHAGMIAPRWGLTELKRGGLLRTDSRLRRAYIDELKKRRTVNGILAVKVQWWEFVRYLDNVEGRELLRDGKFIHLYRGDVVAQAISLHISRQTGQWGPDETITTAPAARPDFYNVPAINAGLDEITLHDMHWRRFFARNNLRPLVLSYEEIATNIALALGRINDEFGLSEHGTVFSYSEEKGRRGSTVAQEADIRARFFERL